jgi:hypothetical protein
MNTRSLLFLLAIATIPVRAQKPCPRVPVPSISSSTLPADVCIPNNFTDVATDFFDDYSWRSFIALVWPAASAHRGVAEDAAKLSGPGTRVFETWKSLWEVFHADGSAPAASFDAWDAPANNACGAKAGFGDLVIASATGLDELAQFGPGELLPPLVAQNGRYVRTQTLYNRAAYDYITHRKLYLRSALPQVPTPRPSEPVVQFPDESVVLKAAWLDLDGFSPAQKSRYYSRDVILKDAATGKCSVVKMGLIGLHIAQKTASRPQWIWSTFEQVDNVPPARPGAPGLFAFHNGSSDAVPAENPLSLRPLLKEPVKPFNVTRATESPIHPKTAYTNLVYERLLKGTVWENYQLVMTQWPRVEGAQSLSLPASLSGDASHTFPGLGSASGSAFANVTMETFGQVRPQVSCMNCHNQARLSADFMWSILDHAYPPNLVLAAGEGSTR